MTGDDGNMGGRGWARGIIAAYGVFALLTLTMVAFAFSRDVHLVSDDYYEREIEHQRHIERVERTNALPEGQQWTFTQDAEAYLFRFPTGFSKARIDGQIHFYRPDDAALDHRVAIALDDDGRQRVAASLLEPGRWRVRIEWQCAGLDYYDEFALTVKAPEADDG